MLNSGESVLFSGCPCQVAGLKAYLGKDYENLFTIDLICHGVPSNRAFKDYIKVLENRKNVKINDFLYCDIKINSFLCSSFKTLLYLERTFSAYSLI